MVSCLQHKIEKYGYAFLPCAFPDSLLSELRSEVSANPEFRQTTNIRHADKKLNSVTKLAQSAVLKNILEQSIGSAAKLVRCIYFNKTANTNWAVAWHQDKTLAVDRRLDRIDWGPWSIKDGVDHVQPPKAYLEKMLTLRIHLDTCDENNGCLLVLPETHLLGTIEQSKIATLSNKYQALACNAEAGDVLLMRPLLIHCSRKARTPKQRAILHMEFSADELPNGLNWA